VPNTVKGVSAHDAIPCSLCAHAHMTIHLDGVVAYFCGLRDRPVPPDLAICSELKLSEKPLIVTIDKTLIGF
jgi:hypothetical protein